MGTDVISSLAGSLDAELEKARETLRCVDDDIKKVFGKDASELTIFGRSRRGAAGQAGGEGGAPSLKDREDFYGNHQQTPGRIRRRDDEREADEPQEKRRRDSFVASGRLGPPMVIGPRFNRPRDSVEDDEYAGPGQGGRRLASRVVSSGKEKSREEVLAQQRQDRSGRERNRRMFGALLGTLQRFKQDETKLKEKEDKRAQIEAKLDEAAKKEREVVKSKKQELIRERKIRLTEIKRIEVKRLRLAELEQWENKTKYLANFIRTETKPYIFYLPKLMNPITECRLEQSKQCVTEMIADKRKLVLEDLEDYEQRSKRYWEGRVAGRASKRRIDPMDQDIEDELNEIMKTEDLPVVGDDGEDFTITVFTEGEIKSPKSENGMSSPAKDAADVKPLVEDIKIELETNQDKTDNHNGEGRDTEETIEGESVTKIENQSTEVEGTTGQEVEESTDDSKRAKGSQNSDQEQMDDERDGE